MLSSLAVEISVTQVFADGNQEYTYDNIYKTNYVKLSTTVTFHNTDSQPHTLTGTDSHGNVITSGIVKPDQTVQMTFSTIGIFDFYDEQNTQKEGTIYIYNTLDDVKTLDSMTNGWAKKVGLITFTLLGQDTIPPTVIPPTNQVVTANNSNVANVYYPQATATDNAGVTSLTCSPISGSVFPIGITTVTCSASDAVGNIGKAMFTVVVKPMIQQPTTTQQPTTQTITPPVTTNIPKPVPIPKSTPIPTPIPVPQPTPTTTSSTTSPTTTIIPSPTTVTTVPSTTPTKIPHWVKSLFGLYGQGEVSDDDLISALKFLIQSGIIKVS